MNKASLIFGQTGQDGSYLAELLLEKGYKVIGCHRRVSNPNYDNIKQLFNNPDFILEECELTDYSSVSSVILKYNPIEIYNLAAMSQVHNSYKCPHLTFEVNTTGVLNILETLRLNKLASKLYQASTSEIFGKNYSTRQIDTGRTIPDFTGEAWPIPEYIVEKYQDENTPPYPISPYAIAKNASHSLIKLYRQMGINCCSGILFNHESPRRSKEFVTRKITSYIGQLVKKCSIKHTGYAPTSPSERIKTDGFVDVGQNNGFSFIPDNLVKYPKLKLGNISSSRDWGSSHEYVEAMFLMLQQPKLDDYVICTGETRTVKEFASHAFKLVGLDYEQFVEIDPDLFRPAEVDYLRGDNSKARKELNWSPKISFNQLVEEMVYADIERAYNER